MEDELLFNQLEKGSQEAFTHIYSKYHKLVYVLAFRYLLSQEAAEDVVQYVFTRLWEYRSELHVTINLKNYLFTMTKNYVLNIIRNENNVVSKNYELFQETPVYEDDLVEKLEQKEMIHIFYQALDKLPQQKREICLMKVNDELTNQQIADKMSLSINTIKTHYSEALKILRIYMRELLMILIFILP